MADEGASDASSDSSNTFWDLATCAAAVAAYAAENPNATAMDSQMQAAPVAFEVHEATGREWVEASLRDPWRCYENFRKYPFPNAFRCNPSFKNFWDILAYSDLGSFVCRYEQRDIS